MSELIYLDKDHEEEQRQDLLPERPDLSGARDEQLQDLYDELPELVENDFLYAVVDKSKEDLKETDIYLTYDAKTRELGSLEVTPRLPIAVGIIRRPLVVFRDYLERAERESTVVRYYFGMYKKDGERIFALVQSHRNIIIKIWTDTDEINLLKMVNGLRIYKSY